MIINCLLKAIKNQTEDCQDFKATDVQLDLVNPVLAGAEQYFSELWNYGMTITISIAINLLVIGSVNRIDFNPTPTQYIDLPSIAEVLDFECDLMGLFVLLHWIRLLKYLIR